MTRLGSTWHVDEESAVRGYGVEAAWGGWISRPPDVIRKEWGLIVREERRSLIAEAWREWRPHVLAGGGLFALLYLLLILFFTLAPEVPHAAR
jgi:hypothetical protein